jgi:hypothetical protein
MPALMLVLLTAPLTPQRWWLERLALVVPGPGASRWLLLADALCLLVLAARTRPAIVWAPLLLGLGFTVLNGLGLALTDFYLALAAFHLIVGAATVAVAGRARWLGGALIALAVVLGLVT